MAEGERDVLTLTRRDGRGEQQVFVRGCGCVENGCRRVCDSLRFRVVGGEGDGVGHAQLVPPEGGRAYGVGAVGELGGGARGGVQPQHVARFKVSAAVRADGGTAAEASASVVPPMEVRMFTAARVGSSGSSFLLHPARASVAASVAANRVLVFILFLFLI